MTHKRPGRAERERRQEEAVERQTVRDKRSDLDQMEVLSGRVGDSKRERARLRKENE